MMITISILYNKAKIQALSLVENHDLLEDRRAELRHTKPTPRINVCACVNLTCNSIANLMRICSERFRRLKMAVKRSDFIIIIIIIIII